MILSATKRTLAICLSITLLALAGCSSSSTTQKSGDEAPAAQTQAASEAKPPAETDADTRLEIENMARPFEGIITAAQPTREQFDKLDDIGVRTVINLRTAVEEGTWDEEAKAAEMGLEYVHIPIGGPQDLTRDNVNLFSDVLRKEQGDFLVHCSSSNRVGALFALRAFWLQDKPPEEAIAIGRKAGLTELEAAVRQKMTE